MVVCDGFIGNVVLKTSEGLADTIVKMLKREIAGMAAGRIGYLFMKPALKNSGRKQTMPNTAARPARNKRHMHNKPREIFIARNKKCNQGSSRVFQKEGA